MGRLVCNRGLLWPTKANGPVPLLYPAISELIGVASGVLGKKWNVATLIFVVVVYSRSSLRSPK